MKEKKLKIMTILGTRPEIIRLSRVMALLDQYVDHLIALSKNADVSNTIRAIARGRLRNIANVKALSSSGMNVAGQHRVYLGEKINAFLDLPEELIPQETLTAPDGSPIGMDAMSCDFDF